MAKLIVLSGVPGSGKSHFCDAFRKSMGGHVYVVSSDALRYEVTGSQQNMDEDKLVWKLFYGMAKVYAMASLSHLRNFTMKFILSPLTLMWN